MTHPGRGQAGPRPPASTVVSPGDAAGAPLLPVVPEDAAVRMAFTGRVPPAGASDANLSLLVGGGDVAAARAAALALVGMKPEQAVFMRQVHGGAVATVGVADRGRGLRDHGASVAGVDALVTHDEDVALVVLVADCVPLLLARPGGGVAAVHAGRRGVAAGVVAAAVAALAPDDPGTVVAEIGPAIGGCCYEVPPWLVDQVAADMPSARATTAWGTPSLDLPAAVVTQLRAAGVRRIRRQRVCTRCQAASFFSHRAKDRSPGRQAGIVVRAGRPDRRSLTGLRATLT